MNFEHLGLKRLISTCYKNKDINLFSDQNSEKGVYIIYDGDKNANKIVDFSELEVREFAHGGGGFSLS